VLELTTVLLDGTVWTSRPLEEQEPRQFSNEPASLAPFTG
jgi:hypothetical protein